MPLMKKITLTSVLRAHVYITLGKGHLGASCRVYYLRNYCRGEAYMLICWTVLVLALGDAYTSKQYL